MNKSFACIDGCVAVVSIKSYLDSTQLNEALLNISSIPDKSAPIFPPGFNVESYDTWSFKVLYASDGISMETAISTVNAFYNSNPVPEQPYNIHLLEVLSLSQSYLLNAVYIELKLRSLPEINMLILTETFQLWNIWTNLSFLTYFWVQF